MTRDAEMERPDEDAAWDAEIDARAVIAPGTRFADLTEIQCWLLTEALRRENRAEAGLSDHRRPYSRLRERDIFDEAHTPRHAKRSHRADVAA